VQEVKYAGGGSARISADEALRLLRENDVRFINLQFTDLYGKLRQTSVSSWTIDKSVFERGLPKLDGSSIQGFVEIYDSDMVLKPDPSTFALIPWLRENGQKTARFLCDIYQGYGKGRFSRDPRWIAEKSRNYAKELGYDVLSAAEVEFFVFDKVSWNVLASYKEASYKVESLETPWNPSADYPIRFKEGYYPTEPQDTLAMIRGESVVLLEDYFGVKCLVHHHEVASSQCEINMIPGDIVATADSIMTLKYVVRNVAKKHGKVATFMPKPIFADNASGMHVHMSLWKGGENAFYDESDEYAELSQTGRYFIGGLLEHARSLSAITSPTTNSYKRLVPGYEAPVYLAWSRGNRSAAVRVPIYQKGENKSKRIEYRPPDPSCNPYLALSAILLAGLDGVKKKIDPGDPVDENIYSMPAEKRKSLGIRELPKNLWEAVEALRSDNEYLKPAVTEDVIEKIIEKEERDFRELEMRPHPYEFQLYFDI